MKISIITPTFNSEKTILRNLDSINNQSFKNIEHIFIDNLSTDKTLEIINQNSLANKKIISEKDKGISDAFNKGILNSSGDIIAILNSDDLFYSPKTLDIVADAFKDETIDFVFGDIYFDDPTLGSNRRKPLECSITKAMPFNHPAFFARKRFYDQLGLYDLSFKHAMDFELISRMYTSPSHYSLKGKKISDEPLVIMHAGGVSWKYELKSLKEIKRILIAKGFYNFYAKKILLERKLRIQIRDILLNYKLASLIKFWRFLKWRN